MRRSLNSRRLLSHAQIEILAAWVKDAVDNECRRKPPTKTMAAKLGVSERTIYNALSGNYGYASVTRVARRET